MGLMALEEAILRELKRVTGNKKLKMKSIMEWSTGDIKLQEGEKAAHLPVLNVNVAYKE